MGFDFDRVIDRTGSGAIKYDMAARGVPEDVLSLWVADMDLAAPDCVLEALHKRVDHGIFGYTQHTEGYWQAVRGWMARRFGWEVQREWLVKTPGVVFAVAAAVRGLTEKGDGVLIQEPVYYPFASSVGDNGRRLVVNELVYEDGRYRVDFEDFERKIVDERVKLFILCSPHNPVGRVWTREELERMGAICLRHGVVVVSDEIHMDFTYPGHTHQVFAGVSGALRDITVTCTAPSKTFNLAGLQISNVFIANPKLRRAFKGALDRTGFDECNAMGLVACEAAYNGGEAWLEALQAYLLGTLDACRAFLRERLPEVVLVEPEGMYLIWLDCTALGLRGPELDRFMLDKAKLWLDNGDMFGPSGDRFVRVNIAAPRALVLQALERLEAAVRAR